MQWIEDDGRCRVDDNVAVLNRARGLWRRIEDDYDRERDAQRNASAQRHTIMTDDAILAHSDDRDRTKKVWKIKVLGDQA